MVDDTFRANVRMIAALAFVPVDDIIPAFEALTEHCGADEEPKLDYFEANYIGELRRARRRDSLFAHELWNINRRVEDDLPKTNNMLGG